MNDQIYANPFGMFQNVNPVQNNPFWSAAMGVRNQQAAMPFMNQMFENQELGLMKNRMQTGEFMSPEAQQSRMTGFGATTAENQSKMRMTPVRDNAETKRISEELRGLPYMTDEKIAKAIQMTNQIKSQPHRELFAELGQLHEVLQGASAEQRPQLYQNVLSRWQQANPGSEIPAQLRMYNDNLLPDLGAIRYAQIHTPQQVGAERLENTRQSGQNSRTHMHELHEDYRARLRLRGDEMRANASMYTTPENRDRAIARLQRERRANPNNEGTRQELTYYLNSAFVDDFQKDMRGAMLATQALSNPQAAAEHEMYQSWSRAKYFDQHGINNDFGQLTFDEFKWLDQALKSNPDAQPEQLIEFGRQRGRIKSRKRK